MRNRGEPRPAAHRHPRGERAPLAGHWTITTIEPTCCWPVKATTVPLPKPNSPGSSGQPSALHMPVEAMKKPRFDDAGGCSQPHQSSATALSWTGREGDLGLLSGATWPTHGHTRQRSDRLILPDDRSSHQLNRPSHPPSPGSGVASQSAHSRERSPHFVQSGSRQTTALTGGTTGSLPGFENQKWINHCRMKRRAW